MTNPSNLLSYSEVPEHIIKKSKGEIREDESRKQQSLQQFKEWIAKHPFIKRCTTDDRHLIPFLRTKKYKMDEVFDIFEKALIFIKSHENWYNFSEENLKRIFDLYDAGFIRVTKDFDSNGRKTIFVNHKNFDTEKFDHLDVFRIHCLVAPILADDEASQICGVNYVLDLSEDFTMKHLTICPLKQLLEFVSQIKFTPLRYKNICIVGLPGFATQFLNIIKLGITDTMLKRLHVLNDVNDLWKFIEKAPMNEKYGGKFTDFETKENFKRIILEKIENYKNFLNFEIDLEKGARMKNLHESVGSFRKLEID